MNLEERGEEWKRVWRGNKHPMEDCLEFAKHEPHPTSLYIRYNGFCMSPLGMMAGLEREGKLALRRLLDRGADPGEIAFVFDEGTTMDAFEFASIRRNMSGFARLLKYGTPTLCRTFNALVTFVKDKYNQNAAGHATAWCLVQIQREDLVLPVIQRLAKISLYQWAGVPESPNKKLKQTK
jgi:hypothetical protein